MRKPDWKRLPPAYRRWPMLAGVAAGLWALVLMYLGRTLYHLVRGEHRVAGFSLLWSTVCFILWRLLHAWVGRRSEG